jgi:CheY-like chemotaxis protein
LQSRCTNFHFFHQRIGTFCRYLIEMSASAATAVKHKILLLDDDPDVLDLFQQMLLQLPSEPEVHISSSGASAMTMLDAEPFNILIADLKMPRMDGLQVLAIVRRKFPALRTVVLTAVTDPQMRARAYAMGIDLFLEKPTNAKENVFFRDCIESLLDSELTGGFRGVQSKSLVDLIQLECLSGSSCILKITNGRLEGRIWIQNGEVYDSATQDVEGEDAFRRILSWRAGNFEILPMDAERPRKIKTSYQGLLLDTAQALDEAQAGSSESGDALSDTQYFSKAGLGRIHGVEFALRVPLESSRPVDKWGIESPEAIAAWVRGAVTRFQNLHPGFELGAVDHFEARGIQRIIHVTMHGSDLIVVGMLPNASKEQISESTKKVLERWAS